MKRGARLSSLAEPTAGAPARLESLAYGSPLPDDYCPLGPAMLSRSEHLILPRHLYAAMVAHAQSELPNECCGILAGIRDGDAWRALAIHPLVNESASPREYHSAPFQAEKASRAAGHEFLAIYHSHPTSAPIPSKTDLERNFYGTSVVHLIVGLAETEPTVRGWWLLEDSFAQADWRIDG